MLDLMISFLRKKIMTKIKLILTLMILSLAASITVAQDGPPPNDFQEPPPGERRDNLARELNLSEQQRLQIRQINRQRRPKMWEAQQNFRQAKDELDELIYSDTLDENAVKVKIQQLAQAQAEIFKIKTQSELAVRNVLTPEQLVKFRTIRSQIKQQQQRRQMQRNRRQLRRQGNPAQRNPNRQNRPPGNRPF
jgi:Spy/CpxP family protein refolding chaperone